MSENKVNGPKDFVSEMIKQQPQKKSTRSRDASKSLLRSSKKLPVRGGLCEAVAGQATFENVESTFLITGCISSREGGSSTT